MSVHPDMHRLRRRLAVVLSTLWLVLNPAVLEAQFTQVTTSTAYDADPYWSPYGDTLVFLSNRSGNWDIWSVPLTGGPATRITNHYAWDVEPTCSPDGSMIAFRSYRGTYQDIWVIEIERPVKSFPFTVHQNYPNPFNPQTTIRFDLVSPSTVSIDIYDSRGRMIRSLANQSIWSAGIHRVLWDGRDSGGAEVVSGTHFNRISTPDYTETRKMVVLQ